MLILLNQIQLVVNIIVEVANFNAVYVISFIHVDFVIMM